MNLRRCVLPCAFSIGCGSLSSSLSLLAFMSVLVQMVMAMSASAHICSLPFNVSRSVGSLQARVDWPPSGARAEARLPPLAQNGSRSGTLWVGIVSQNTPSAAGYPAWSCSYTPTKSYDASVRDGSCLKFIAKAIILDNPGDESSSIQSNDTLKPFWSSRQTTAAIEAFVLAPKTELARPWLPRPSFVDDAQQPNALLNYTSGWARNPSLASDIRLATEATMHSGESDHNNATSVALSLPLSLLDFVSNEATWDWRQGLRIGYECIKPAGGIQSFGEAVAFLASSNGSLGEGSDFALPTWTAYKAVSMNPTVGYLLRPPVHSVPRVKVGNQSRSNADHDALAVISAGSRHACGVVAGTGDVVCWGDHSGGATGIEPSSRVEYAGPRDIGSVALGPGMRARDVCAGLDSTCVALDNGGVTCFGRGSDSWMGLRSEASNEAPYRRPVVHFESPVERLSCWAYHGVAVLRDGTMRTWGGSGPYGYLGRGGVVRKDDTFTLADPVTPDLDYAEQGGVLDACAMLYATAVLFKNGRVKTFGEMRQGSIIPDYDDDLIGPPDTKVITAPRLLDPVNLLNGSLVESISCGAFHVCAVLRDGAGSICWGLPNPVGYTCRGGACNSYYPETLSAIEFPPDMGRIVQADASPENSCFLDDHGYILCTGETVTGVAMAAEGLSPLTQDANDSLILDLGEPAYDLACGTRFCCAILQSLRVRCWGQGTEGQLGNGQRTLYGDDEPISASPPVPIGQEFAVAQVDVGGVHVCALGMQGQIRCFGSVSDYASGFMPNDDEGIGVVLGDDEHARRGRPVELPPDKEAVQVCAAAGYGCAVVRPISSLSRSMTRHDDDWVSLRYGQAHITGLEASQSDYSENDLYCWGTLLQVGNGDFTAVDPRPSKVPLPTGNISWLDCAERYVCVTGSNGTFCFGYFWYPNPDFVTQTADFVFSAIAPAIPQSVHENIPAVWVDVAVGASHTVMISDVGHVYFFGTIPTGFDTPGPRIYVVADVNRLEMPEGRRAVRACSGVSHSCVILEGGKLLCFGSNDMGQLGFGVAGAFMPGAPLYSVPFVDFGDRSAFAVDVSCGSSFTCAIVIVEGTRREIRCFGSNDNGQLGRSTATKSDSIDTTVASNHVSLGGRIPEYISCGLTTACVVLSGGAVTCWGTAVSVYPERLLGRGQPLPEGRWAASTRSSLVQFGRRRPAVVQLPSGERSYDSECSDLEQDVAFLRGTGWLLSSPSGASTVAVVSGPGPCNPASASLAFGTAEAFQLNGWQLREGISGGLQALLGSFGFDEVSKTYLGTFVGRQLIVPGTSYIVSERSQQCDTLDQQVYADSFSSLLDSIALSVYALTSDGLVATAGGSRLKLSSPILELLQHLRPNAVPEGVQLQVRSAPATDCNWNAQDGIVCMSPPGYGESSPTTACLPGLARRSGHLLGPAAQNSSSAACTHAGHLSFLAPYVRRISPSAGLIPCPFNRSASGCGDIEQAELGGFLIRLVGSGFGPLREKDGFLVLIGDQACMDARVESDLEIACVLPHLLGDDWPVTVLVGGQTSEGPTVSFATPVVQAVSPSALMPSSFGGKIAVVMYTRGLAPTLLQSVEIGGSACDSVALGPEGLLRCDLHLPESFNGTDGSSIIVRSAMRAGASGWNSTVVSVSAPELLELAPPPSIFEIITFGVPTSGMLRTPIGVAGAGLGFSGDDIQAVLVNKIPLNSSAWLWRSPNRVELLAVPPGVGTGIVRIVTSQGLQSNEDLFEYDSAQVELISPDYMLAGQQNATVAVCGNGLPRETSSIVSLVIGGTDCLEANGRIYITSLLGSARDFSESCVECYGFDAPTLWAEPDDVRIRLADSASSAKHATSEFLDTTTHAKSNLWINQTGRFRGEPAPVIKSLSYASATVDGGEIVQVFGSGYGRSERDIARVRICDRWINAVVDRSTGIANNVTTVWLSPGEMAVALPPGVVSCEVLIESSAGLYARSGSNVVRQSPSIEVVRPSYILAGDDLSDPTSNLIACGSGLLPLSWQDSGNLAHDLSQNSSVVSMRVLGIECLSIASINSSCIRCDGLSDRVPSDIPSAASTSAMLVRSGDRTAGVSPQVFSAVSRPSVATLSPPYLPKDLDEAVLYLGSGFGETSDDLSALYMLADDAGSGALTRLAANLAIESSESQSFSEIMQQLRQPSQLTRCTSSRHVSPSLAECVLDLNHPLRLLAQMYAVGNLTALLPPFARAVACNKHGVCSVPSEAVVQLSQASVSFPPLFVPWDVRVQRSVGQSAVDVQWWYPTEAAESAALGQVPSASALHTTAKYFVVESIELKQSSRNASEFYTVAGSRQTVAVFARSRTLTAKGTVDLQHPDVLTALGSPEYCSLDPTVSADALGSVRRIAIADLQSSEPGPWQLGEHLSAARQSALRHWVQDGVQLHRIAAPLASDGAFAIRISATDYSGYVLYHGPWSRPSLPQCAQSQFLDAVAWNDSYSTAPCSGPVLLPFDVDDGTDQQTRGTSSSVVVTTDTGSSPAGKSNQVDSSLQCFYCPSDQADCSGRARNQIEPLPGYWRVPWAAVPDLAFATCPHPWRCAPQPLHSVANGEASGVLPGQSSRPVQETVQASNRPVDSLDTLEAILSYPDFLSFAAAFEVYLAQNESDNYAKPLVCAEGYTGVLCESCAAGYVRLLFGSCGPCPSRSTSIGIAFVVCVAMLAFYGALVARSHCNAVQRTRRQDEVAANFKISSAPVILTESYTPAKSSGVASEVAGARGTVHQNVSSTSGSTRINTRSRKETPEEALRRLRSSSILKVILGHLQMLAMCAIVDAGWPNLLEYAIVGATTASSVGAYVVAPMCLLPQEDTRLGLDGQMEEGIWFGRSSLYYSSAAILVLPVVLLGAVVVGAAVLQAVSGCRQLGFRTCCNAWTVPVRLCLQNCGVLYNGGHQMVPIPIRDRAIIAGASQARRLQAIAEHYAVEEKDVAVVPADRASGDENRDVVAFGQRERDGSISVAMGDEMVAVADGVQDHIDYDENRLASLANEESVQDSSSKQQSRRTIAARVRVPDSLNEFQPSVPLRFCYASITVAFLAYSTMTTAALRLQACVSVGADRSELARFEGSSVYHDGSEGSQLRMLFELDVRCDDSKSTSLRYAMSIPVLLLVSLGLPLVAVLSMVFTGIYQVPRWHCVMDHEPVGRRSAAIYRYLWGFLTVGMRSGFDSWEAVNMTRKALAGCAVVFLAPSGPFMQLAAMLGVTVSFLLLYVGAAPYDHALLNRLQLGCYGLLVVTLLVALAGVADADSGLVQVLGGFTTTAHVAVVLFGLYEVALIGSMELGLSNSLRTCYVLSVCSSCYKCSLCGDVPDECKNQEARQSDETYRVPGHRNGLGGPRRRAGNRGGDAGESDYIQSMTSNPVAGGRYRNPLRLGETTVSPIVAVSSGHGQDARTSRASEHSRSAREWGSAGDMAASQTGETVNSLSASIGPLDPPTALGSRADRVRLVNSARVGSLAPDSKGVNPMIRALGKSADREC